MVYGIAVAKTHKAWYRFIRSYEEVHEDLYKAGLTSELSALKSGKDSAAKSAKDWVERSNLENPMVAIIPIESGVEFVFLFNGKKQDETIVAGREGLRIPGGL